MRKLPISVIPVTMIACGVIILLAAAVSFPGPAHWTRTTASTLCRATTVSGDPNPVRWIAISGLILICTGKAIIFQFISTHAKSRVQHDIIQIGGIGSMVYSAFTATPMHNLMVNIAVAFFLPAVIAIIWMLFQQGHRKLALFGCLCLMVQVAGAAIYYIDFLPDYWGIFQKFTSLCGIAWLVSVFFGLHTNKPQNSVADIVPLPSATRGT